MQNTRPQEMDPRSAAVVLLDIPRSLIHEASTAALRH